MVVQSRWHTPRKGAGGGGGGSFKGTSTQTGHSERGCLDKVKRVLCALSLWYFDHSMSQTFHKDLRELCELVEKGYSMSPFKPNIPIGTIQVANNSM